MRHLIDRAPPRLRPRGFGAPSAIDVEETGTDGEGPELEGEPAGLVPAWPALDADGFVFTACGVPVALAGRGRGFRHLRSRYGGFARGEDIDRVRLRYDIAPGGWRAFRLELRHHGRHRLIGGLASLDYLVDRDLLVALQRLRSDLLFVHGAVVEHEGAAHAIVAASGVGKSTLCWRLLSEGVRFVSDEAVPIDPDHHSVVPFPRALHLKRRPPSKVPLSTRARRSGHGYQIPVERALAVDPGRMLPLRSLYFLERSDRATPQIFPLDPGASALRLYPHALNPLAHANAGLATVAGIAERVPGFEIRAGGVDETARALVAHLGRQGR